MFVITSIRKQGFLISMDTRLRKKRWKRFFRAREKIDRVERVHGLQLERHQTGVASG
jgi:hypothetical protein